MPLKTEEIIDKLQDEIVARLEADEFFCDIPVILADEGNIKAEIARKQAIITKKTNKRGIAAVVLQIEADDEYPELEKGPLKLKPAVEFIEQRELNRHPTLGTGKSARRAARRGLLILKPLALPGLVTTFVAERPCIVSVPYDPDEPSTVRQQLMLHCFEADSDNSNPIANMPSVEQDGNTLLLSTSTPNAEIWFTLDDSPPSRLRASADGQSGSIKYAGPIPISAGAFPLRAVAYAPGMIASNPFRAVITAS